jgi:RHH-type transcriptional regulator, proline utilization regulon repressor / proline dehydrogenase / delta 1-pyrroline-5-carboxylate dehydrogenase
MSIKNIIEYNSTLRNEKIPLPMAIYNSNNLQRKNSRGLNLAYLEHKSLLIKHFEQYDNEQLLDVKIDINVNNAAVNIACTKASEYYATWNNTSIEQRSEIFNTIADTMESDKYYYKLIYILVHEAHKTIDNAVAEIREAIDFLRYYSLQINDYASTDRINGLGLIACISPWNFPLAIFMGQIVAAMIAGNTVVAKPAEQTNIIASLAIQIMHECGIDKNALHIVYGDGESVGAALVSNNDVQGVIFTGSLAVAKIIQHSLTLANNISTINNKPKVLIAETGGQNVMIVDSSALIEQAIKDVMQSAFDSAGQRCSALRILYVQQDIFAKFTAMLEQAMQQLNIGHTSNISNDIGAIIDMQAAEHIHQYINNAKNNIGHKVYSSHDIQDKNYVSPTIIYINNLADMGDEIFGPVLHIFPFNSKDLHKVIDDINALGYGLTFAMHSRIDSSIAYAIENMHIGNIYINRNSIGAVVGVQPFGGHGLSGTGPKAGGPLYLAKLMQSNYNIKNKILAICEHYKSNPMLVGITGEENTYMLTIKKNVLCIADTLEGLENQLAQLYQLDANITPMILECHYEFLDMLKVKNIDIKNIKVTSSVADAGFSTHLDAVLVDINRENCSPSLHLPGILHDIAQHYLYIIPVININDDNSYAIESLILEKSVSNNTTASGGNASLMNL